METLRLCLKKKRDGVNVLSCVRADGSTSWQQHQGPFFVHHDLTHYAIETTLGLRRAFYGLLAGGWEFTDFGTPWPHGKFPEDAMAELTLAEHLAGAFDLERATGAPVEAGVFNAMLAQRCEEAGIANPLSVIEEDLTRIRATYAELIARWFATPAGETLELPFPATGSAREPTGAVSSRRSRTR
jgi:hypothetical protein